MMKYLKIKPYQLRYLPLPLNYVRYYPKALIEDKPDRMGIPVPAYNHQHYFPYGPPKAISTCIDFENADLDEDTP